MRAAPPRPKGDQVIWRYISIDKYLDFLLTSSLKFTQIKIAADLLETELMRHRLRSSGAFDGKEEHLDGSKIYIEAIRKTHYISCWTGKKTECRSLWHSYLGASHIGVAIKSTVDQIINSADWGDYSFDYREVDYRDEFEDIEELQVITTLLNVKAEAYSSEEEIRFTIIEDAVDLPEGELSAENPPRIKNEDEFPKVIPIKIRLEDCVDEIWISPFCSEWQISMLRDVTAKINSNLVDRLRRSDVKEKIKRRVMRRQRRGRLWSMGSVA
ncbi:MAG: hypothetical protein CMO55_15910 [Verrucomicrobiales bacterium]|nr:hypothetical protein [Verrucomicrobiales bacterium]